MTPRLQEKYHNEIIAELKEEFGYDNAMQIPKLVKVSVNIGLGEAIQNIKILDTMQEDLRAITGQHAVIARAKKSIATYKLREGMPIGTFVTLRRQHMWEFLDRLINVALPRVRDFRGISNKAFDGNGNYNLGIKEHIIFPEIEVENIGQARGLNISVVTSAKTDKEAFSLLKKLGMPFQA